MLGDKTFYTLTKAKLQNLRKKIFVMLVILSYFLPQWKNEAVIKHNKQQSCNKLITTILAPMSCFTESQIDTVLLFSVRIPFLRKYTSHFRSQKKKRKTKKYFII